MNTSKRIEPGEYTGRELRDLAPEVYAKKFKAWDGDAHHDWWDFVYEDLNESPQYYHPKVVEFYKKWKPQIQGGDIVSQDAYHALAEHYMGVITGLIVSSFDLYPREITLDFDLSFRQWVRDQTFPTDNPLFINVLLDWVQDEATHNLIGVGSGTRDPVSYINDARPFAVEWYMKLTGSEMEPMVRGWREPDDAIEFGESFEQWVDDTIEPMIDEFIDGVEREVLFTLEAEYEYLTSEDCFLESYIEVTEDDLLEIENAHE